MYDDKCLIIFIPKKFPHKNGVLYTSLYILQPNQYSDSRFLAFSHAK